MGLHIRQRLRSLLHSARGADAQNRTWQACFSRPEASEALTLLFKSRVGVMNAEDDARLAQLEGVVPGSLAKHLGVAPEWVALAESFRGALARPAATPEKVRSLIDAPFVQRGLYLSSRDAAIGITCEERSEMRRLLGPLVSKRQ